MYDSTKAGGCKTFLLSMKHGAQRRAAYSTKMFCILLPQGYHERTIIHLFDIMYMYGPQGLAHLNISGRAEGRRVYCMDQRLDKLEGAGKHIWLRYATQFTANGRTYTLEMSVPMPIGASAELREQLLTEADAGMNQLASHVEHRAAQMLQQAQLPQETVPTPPPVAQPAATLQRPTKPTPTPATSSLPQPVVQEATQPVASIPVVRETAPEAVDKEVPVPATRTTVGASMPAATMVGATGGNLTISEFVKLINESMGLNPKQAMEMLKVKSLNGLNLRDALERLQRMQSAVSAANRTLDRTSGGTD